MLNTNDDSFFRYGLLHRSINRGELKRIVFMLISYCMVFIINTDLNIYTWKIILVSRYLSRIWEDEFELEVAIRTGYLQ